MDSEDVEKEGEVGLSAPVTENASEVGVPPLVVLKFKLEFEYAENLENEDNETRCDSALGVANKSGLGACAGYRCCCCV